MQGDSSSNKGDASRAQGDAYAAQGYGSGDFCLWTLSQASHRPCHLPARGALAMRLAFLRNGVLDRRIPPMRRRVSLRRTQHAHHVAARNLLEVRLRIAAPGELDEQVGIAGDVLH